MFWRGVLGYLPVNIVQALAGFGSIILFTRLLSPTDYGVYALAYSAQALVYTCLFIWIESAMARFYAAEAHVAGQARADMFATLYITFAAMAVALPVVSGLVLWLLPVAVNLKIALAAGLASIIFRSLLKMAQEHRRASGQVRAFALFDMLQTGGAFAIGAALALAGLGGAAPLIGIGVSSLVLLAFAAPAELRETRGGRFRGERLRDYAHYGLPVALSLVMSLALATTDRFVLAGFMNEATVGAYHAGYTLSNRTLDVMFVWLGMAGQPACIMALERGGKPALMRTAREQAGFMVMVALPASVGLALVAKPLAEVMVGPALSLSAARVTPWIAVSALFAGLTTHYLHTAFTLARKTRLLFLVIAVPALANLGLTLLLIPRFGLDGAMWATTASYAIGMVAAYALGRRVLALPIPWETIARSGAAVLVMALAIRLMPNWGGAAELLAKAAVGALVYAVAAYLLDAGQARTRGAKAIQGLRLRFAA